MGTKRISRVAYITYTTYSRGLGPAEWLEKWLKTFCVLNNLDNTTVETRRSCELLASLETAWKTSIFCVPNMMKESYTLYRK